jgi:hypothetical protein
VRYAVLSRHIKYIEVKPIRPAYLAAGIATRNPALYKMVEPSKVPISRLKWKAR